VSNSEVLESACGVLITAAGERQIGAHNAARVRASLVLEAVSNSVTPAAEAILSARDITVIPALLGAAPRTLAWFSEWQQGLRCAAPEQAVTEFFIRNRLTEIFRRCQVLAADKRVSLPEACRLLALEKLSERWRLTA
jgi:glutamate dehydrogenase